MGSADAATSSHSQQAVNLVTGVGVKGKMETGRRRNARGATRRRTETLLLFCAFFFVLETWYACARQGRGLRTRTADGKAEVEEKETTTGRDTQVDSSAQRNKKEPGVELRKTAQRD